MSVLPVALQVGRGAIIVRERPRDHSLQPEARLTARVQPEPDVVATAAVATPEAPAGVVTLPEALEPRTKDGIEQRTIVLAVERNTKVMEPLTRETGE